MTYALIGKCTVYVLSVMLVVILLIILFFICVYIYGIIEDYHYQKKWWNKGISPNTNEPWAFLRRYDKRCVYGDDKGYEVTIDFRSIDKYKIKDEKK